MIKLAVLGSPIAHSVSPLIHGIFAEMTGLQVDYGRILVEGDFVTTVKEFFASGGSGCNITVPCKIDACHFADQLTDAARIAQAVNTLKFCPQEGEHPAFFLGDNTDGAGLLSDLMRLDCPLAGAHILLLGAGGAARGIVPPLMAPDVGVASITVVNRTKDKAVALVNDMMPYREQVGSNTVLNAVSFEELASAPSQVFNVMLNATSLSLKHELPSLSDELLSRAAFVYDLFYTLNGKTVFTEKAAALGVPSCHDGLGMLVGQAALSFKLWTGKSPDLGAALELVRTRLSQQH